MVTQPVVEWEGQCRYQKVPEGCGSRQRVDGSLRRDEADVVPEAEDAVLVQEKILDAELHLKVDIPNSTLEKTPKFRSRLDGR